MAMNLGYKTTKIFINPSTSAVGITNDQYDDNWTGGQWGGGNVIDITGAAASLRERDFIDIGAVTDEREETVTGGMSLSLATKGADARSNWSVGGRILRVTLSGIVADGIYVSVDGTGFTGDINLNDKSNVSVFRYKLNKYSAYQNLAGQGKSAALLPGTILYRRKYIYEIFNETSPGSDTETLITGWTNVARWNMTGYSISFINGTRNIRYSISLELANNVFTTSSAYLSSDTIGIRPRSFGDI